MPIINSGSGFYVGRRFDVQLSAELRHKGDPIFERFFDGNSYDIVNVIDDTILIPNHFFRTGEEISYQYEDFFNDSDAAIGIATTTIVGVGNSIRKLPQTVYAVVLNDRFIQLAATKDRALKRIPEVFDLTSVGFGTFHKFIGEKQNTRSLITIDNVIQTPAIDTEIKTQLLEDLSSGSDLLIVAGITSFFNGDIIRVNNEIMRINLLGVGNTTSMIVRRPLLGTGLASHSAGDAVVKLTGNYKIVDNIIYFPVAPFDKSPTTDLERKNPLDRDYVGIETFSTFDGRVFLRSGFEDSNIGPYDRNYLLDDISNQFLGISTQAVLKQQGQNVSGFSTGNALILINNVFQTPDFIDYGLGESSGITTISFTGEKNSSPEDINTASIPRGGIIVSVGTNEGFGYQPLVAAGGTAKISNSGTVESVFIGYTGSGYRSPETYTLETRILSPTYEPTTAAGIPGAFSGRFFLDNQNGLFKKLEYFLNGSPTAKCTLSVRDSVGNNYIENNGYTEIVSVGNTYVEISSGLDAWSEVFDSSSFNFLYSTNTTQTSLASTDRIKVSNIIDPRTNVGIDTNSEDFYLTLGSVATNEKIISVDAVNKILVLDNPTSGSFVNNTAVTIKTFTPGIIQTNIGDIAYITVTQPNVGVVDVYLNGEKQFAATEADYTNTTGIVTITAPGFSVAKGELVDLRDFKYTCDSGGKFGESYGSFNQRVGINSIVVNNKFFSVTNATYDPTSGISTLTIGIHSLTTGDRVFIEPESLGFSCTLDGNSTTTYYPRIGDPAYNFTVGVITSTATKIEVNVGSGGSDTSLHTFERVGDSTLTSDSINFTSATYDPASGIATLTIGNHSLSASDSYNVLYADYDPASGISTLSITNTTHPLQIGEKILLSSKSLGFTCTLDGNSSVTYYPRLTDPASDSLLTITSIGSTTIEVNVGTSTDLSQHTFVGVNTDKPNPVKVSFGDYIFIEPESLGFSCTLNPAITTYYPRETDPAYNKLLEILDVTSTTVEVYVGFSDPGDVYPHTFEGTNPSIENPIKYSINQTRYSTGIVTFTTDGDVENTLFNNELVLFNDTGTLLDKKRFTVINTPISFDVSTNGFEVDVNEILIPPPPYTITNSSGSFVLATILLPSGKFGYEFEVLETIGLDTFVLDVGEAPQNHLYIGGGLVKNVTRKKGPIHIGVSSIRNGHVTNVEITNTGIGFTQFNLFTSYNLTGGSLSGSTILNMGNVAGIDTYKDYVSIDEDVILSKIISVDEELSQIKINDPLPSLKSAKTEIKIYRFDDLDLNFDDPLSYQNLSLVYSSNSVQGIGSYAKANVRIGNDGKIKEFELLSSGYSYGQGEILTIPTGGVTGVQTFSTNQINGISTAIGIFTGSIASNDDRFGFSVGISSNGSTMVVGSPFGEGSALNSLGIGTASGVAYVFDRVGNSFSQVGILTGEYSYDLNDNFGYSVAMSGTGNLIVVGAPSDEKVGIVNNYGTAYVFERSSGPTFSQVGVLTGSNSTGGLSGLSLSNFGWDVDITSDGNLIVVGSPRDPNLVSARVGSVYVFEKVAGPTFNEIAILQGSNASLEDRFGFSVAISPDGSHIVVGAPEDEDTGVQSDNFGLVYIFEKVGASINQVGILTSPKLSELKNQDNFGYSVDVSKNGNIIAVGAKDDTSIIGGNITGLVYIFEKILGSYYLIQVLQGTYSNQSGDDFGSSLSISDDGEVVVIGSINDESINLPSSSGVAYVYERKTKNYLGSDYANVGIITGTYAYNLNDNFATSVAISGNKNSFIVGSQYDELTTTGIGTSGVAYVYDLSIGSTFEEFEIIVDQTFTDEFSGYVFGDLVVFDNISRLFNGKRKEFPFRLGGTQTTLRARPGSTLNLEYNLLIFINDIYQVPNQSYTFSGGSTFTFSEAPNSGDKCVIVFYYGTTEVDTRLVDILETIKIGDLVTLNSQDFSLQQNSRTVTDIRSTDIIETNSYSSPGVSGDINLLRSVKWCKQLVDKVVDGVVIGKSRVPYEPEIYPKTQIIKSVGIGSTESIFVESLKTFFDSDDEYENIGVNKDPQDDIIIISNDQETQANATISLGSDLRISNISLQSGGSGYSQAPDISISYPNFTGIGTTTNERAQAICTIDSNGSVDSIVLTNPGYGYSTSGTQPVVFIGPPTIKYEIIQDVLYEGDFGWVTGIGTTSTLLPISSVGVVTGLYASNLSDFYGCRMAVSSDGSTFVVGSYRDELQNEDPNIDYGLAYVYDKSGSTITQVGVLTGTYASNQDDYFGWSVAMSGNGGIIAVAARQDETLDINSVNNGGVIYVYERSGLSFIGISTLLGSLTTGTAQVSWSLAMSEDGSTLVAGCKTAGNPAASGITYVFKKQEDNTFVEFQVLFGSVSDQTLDYFGSSVDTNSDGSIIVVGSEKAGTDNVGRAYVFKLIGGSYQQTDILRPETLTDSGSDFGNSVAIANEKNTIVVGSINGEEVGNPLSSGVVYIYDINNGNYSLTAKVTGSLSIDGGDYFGSSVDISSNGRVLLVGAYQDESSGRSYVFNRSGNAFIEIAILQGQYSNDAADGFGRFVCLDKTGSTLLVGAERDENPNSESSSGAVHIFENPTPDGFDKNFVFELYITENSYLRDETLGSPITESQIQPGYYFKVSKSNVGSAVTGFGINSVNVDDGTIRIFEGDRYIDGVYQVSSVSIARTEVPGLVVGFGRTEVVRVVTPVESYNNLDVPSGGFIGNIGAGYTFGQYFGDFSWGRMSELKRTKNISFDAYINGESGISSSPSIVRINPLKYENYTSNN
jgi:hypothetical protein